MLMAEKAHGRPIMVIAMMTAAISQPTAIHRPPKTIQRTLSNNDSGLISHLFHGAPYLGRVDAGSMAPDKLIEQRRRPRPAGRTGFHLVGKAGHGETVVGELFEIAQFLHVAIRNLASGLVALPDDQRIVRLQPALARMRERHVPAPGIDAGDAHAA